MRRTSENTVGAQPIRQASLREHNLALVLSIILDAAIPPSRADMAGATGLTRATVSALVDALVDAGLVTELDPVNTAKAGRPAVPLIPAIGAIAGIGVEIAVDHIGICAVDLAGTVLDEDILPGGRRNREAEEVLGQARDRVETMVRSLHTRSTRIAGIMVALPGLIDRNTGKLRFAPNLGWRDVDMTTQFAQSPVLSTITISVANEAKLAAVAELSKLRQSEEGGAAGLTNFIYVSGEVGIGSALMIDGDIFTGQRGWGGELGHVVVEPNGPVCGCGAQGCLEQYAGRLVLLEKAGLPLNSSIEELVEAAQRDDTKAQMAVVQASRALGIALADMINIVDVDTVVLGGIYSPLSSWLIAGIEEELNTRVLAAPWTQPKVFPAITGPQAVRMGAALAALAPVRRTPMEWL